MNDHESESDSTVKREFYAPATFQFTTTPGRIERTLGRLFRERGAMVGRPRTAHGMRTFYVPATFQFATAPGRVERLVGDLLRQRAGTAGHPRTTVEVREFYAPATFQFATTPGRVERLVAGTLRQRGTTDGRRRADGSEHATPASSTTKTTVSRRGRRPEAR